jgi:hypothetical protein
VKEADMAERVFVPDQVTGKIVPACCSRRGFLRNSMAAGLAAAALAAKSKFALAGDAPSTERPIEPGATLAGHGKAKRAIFVYLQGGPSHLDTFDPKPGRPTGGPFKPVATAIPGVYLGERLPKLAGQIEKFAVIRSMTSKEGNHSRARTLVHTAYAPEATVTHPSFGAAVSRERGKPDFDLPNFISIGAQQDAAGFLGVEHGPFVIDNPNRPIQNLDYNRAVGADRVSRRLELLEGLQKDFAATHGKDATEGRDDMFKKAKRLVDTKLRDAFDLSKEDEKLRDAYGRTETGAACLMARRLAEAGVSCVEVVVNGWDTHDDNFTRVGRLCDALDPALATLLSDLAQRGLLDGTLVACFGEFGRTPRINPRAGRDHWAKSWSALVAGGGTLGGQIIGSTDEDGMAPKERPVQVADLHASFWHAFGVDPWTEYQANDRPITLTPKDGRVVKELFV